MKFFQNPNSFVIITGASRGFGRTILRELIKKYRQDYPESSPESGPTDSKCKFVVISKNSLPDFNDVIDSDKRIEIHPIYLDLSVEQDLSEVKSTLQKLTSSGSFGHCLLVHNAGSLGDTKTLCEDMAPSSSGRLAGYYQLNLFSVMQLTAVVLQTVESLWTENVLKKLDIVNISSLAAVKSMTGCVDYCTGKAAREAYFRQLNDELSAKHPSRRIRILNYAPGPLETEMFASLQTESRIASDFASITPLKTEVSAQTLVLVLSRDDFKNCDHIDYYDVPDRVQ